MSEPVSKTKDQDPQQAVRTEILRHAHDLFSHYGYWKTNIGDIAERCGMSPGNLYRYYRNKQAIGLAAVAQYFEMVEAAMETVLLIPEGSAEARLRAFVTTGVRHLADELERNPKIVELADFLCSDDKGLELLSTHIAWKRTRMTREIERGVAAGELAPCDAEQMAGTLLNALKSFWVPMMLASWRDPKTILPELDQILDLMFGGLRA